MKSACENHRRFLILAISIVECLDSFFDRGLWEHHHGKPCECHTCDKAADMGEESDTTTVFRRSTERSETVDQLEDKPKAENDEGRPFLHLPNTAQANDATYTHIGEENEVATEDTGNRA